VLARHYADYDAVGTLYARSSGTRRFVEIELGFDGAKSVEHVHVLSRHMEQALAAELPGLHFRIVPVWEPDDEWSAPGSNSGAISDALHNYKGDTCAPDHDLYIWGWGEYVDPDYILNVFTTGQIEGWNDPIWSNAEYDKLYDQQAQTIDPAKRKPLVDRTQQIFCSEAPFIVINFER